MRKPTRPPKKSDSKDDQDKADAVIGTDVGNQLRALYHSLKAEPVPKRFYKLVKKLEAEDPASKAPRSRDDHNGSD